MDYRWLVPKGGAAEDGARLAAWVMRELLPEWKAAHGRLPGVVVCHARDVDSVRRTAGVRVTVGALPFGGPQGGTVWVGEEMVTSDWGLVTGTPSSGEADAGGIVQGVAEAADTHGRQSAAAA
jgi:hypothetical protein